MLCCRIPSISLRQGVSLDAQFNEGNTLMHFAVSLDMYAEVAFLLDAGANCHIVNSEVLRKHLCRYDDDIYMRMI